MYSCIINDASPWPPLWRFSSHPRRDKLVRKYMSSTSNEMVSSSIMNWDLSGSQYPINSYNNDVSNLMDDIWKYFSCPHYLKMLTIFGSYKASLSAPSCSRSCHSITIMDNLASSTKYFISWPSRNEKMLKIVMFPYTCRMGLLVSACTCGHRWDPPHVGLFTCTRTVYPPRVCSIAPNRPWFSGGRWKFLKKSMKYELMASLKAYLYLTETNLTNGSPWTDDLELIGKLTNLLHCHNQPLKMVQMRGQTSI